jgi:hypothetical protein
MFNPEEIKTFKFLSYEFDKSKYTVNLNYSFDDKYYFTEEIIFNNANINLDVEKEDALNKVLSKLHLVAGASYYKAAIPNQILIKNQKISKYTSEFMKKLYIKGLGEFSYKNNLSLQEKINFPYDEEYLDIPSNYKLENKSIIPVGGGKDSVVTIEALRSSNDEIILFSVGNMKPIKDVCSVSGYPHIYVTRKISPLLFELNSQGAYNGHVPISGILAFIMAAASIIYGFRNIIMSNERSANVGNLVKDGLEINHQYSKSLEFEKDINQYFKKVVLKDLNYFSFLRPLSELHIAKLFSKEEKYHSVFTSCNSAFKIHEDKRVERWCLNCDKCRFVFLALSPFMEKEKVIKIFGRNLLNDEKQLLGFYKLVGYKEHKPFECVGEIEESLLAFLLINEKEEWKNDYVVKNIIDKFTHKIKDKDKIFYKVFSISEKSLLDSKYKELLNEYIRLKE